MSDDNDKQPVARPISICKDTDQTFSDRRHWRVGGGLAAFELFFRHFPRDRQVEIAFVVVQHLAPEPQSSLVELLRPHTDMPVYSVISGTQVRSQCVYVLPPNHEMTIQGGVLNLLPLTEPRSQRLRSMASSPRWPRTTVSSPLG